MDADVHIFLDDRNQTLWEDLSTYYNIALQTTDAPYFHNITEGKQVTIYVPQGSTSKEAFIHELLHILLRSKGCYVTTDLYFKVLESAPLRELGIEKYLWEIGNHLEHQKILPLFLQMGCPREAFIADYHELPFDVKHLQYMEENLRSHNWRTSTIIYLKSFFSIKASTNPCHKCEPILDVMQDLEPDLYVILDDFWAAWTVLDIETYRDNTHRKAFVDAFATRLDIWGQVRQSDAAHASLS